MNLLLVNLLLANLLLESLPYRLFPDKVPTTREYPHRLDSTKLAPGKSDPVETLGEPVL